LTGCGPNAIIDWFCFVGIVTVFESRNGIFKPATRPIRIVLRWQLIVTAVLALLAAIPWGIDGAISAALGGLVNVVAGGVYGLRVTRVTPISAGETLRTLFRAWAFKVVLIVGQMWLVLTQYRDLVHAAFFLAFAITVGVFSAAIAVRDTE
jgi:ATP synthase protein I